MHPYNNVSKILDKSSADFAEAELNSVYDVLLPKDAIPYAYDADTDKTDLRDLLDSELKQSPSVWSNESWDHIATWKRAVMDCNLVKNNSYNPYREYNYKKCYWLKAKGQIYQSIDGQKIYKQRISCGEKTCLRCDKNKRKRQGLEAVKDIKALFDGMPGAPGILFITFTLPENIEGIPIKDPGVEKKIKNKIHKIVRELFGRKTRSNIGLRLAVHAVGSKDIMRDRWHCHVDIIPGEIVKHGDESQYHWLSPTRIRRGSKDPWVIDLLWLKERWLKALQDLNIANIDNLANPQVEFVKYPGEKTKRKIFWAKITHKITYNLRSFASDFEKSFLRSDYENYRIILKAASGRVGYWYNLAAGDVVDRFLFVRQKTVFRKRGFLSCLKKYKSALTLLYPEPEPIKACYPAVEAEIITTISKRYLSKNKFRTEQEELWRWICPITRAVRIEIGSILCQWKGG